MADAVPFSQSISIRQSGRDERWLHDQIWNNPACLGLGDLVPVERERRQSSGGRIDILLKDPDDDSMYEVEVMLEETDETHIIRTIEYWDNEKRRWPQRQHFAVLVAEHINRRFFNVIHLLSYSIPIVAIQASLLECNGVSSLFFTKVLDTYEEVDDGTTTIAGSGDRSYWQTSAPWTVETAQAVLDTVQDLFKEPSLNFVWSYVAISVSGNNYFWLHKRSAGKSSLCFWLAPALEAEATAALDANGIPFQYEPKRRNVRTTVDRNLIESKKDLIRKLADLVKRSWEQLA